MRQHHANDWFEFKQFRVEQGHSGMKVTTHACVFGSLVPVAGARCVLDIGAGTGLLSLMLAQRSTAVIDAVELDAGACADAARNFSASPWSGRLHLHCGPIQTFLLPQLPFLSPPEPRYDCVISNPPFFSGSWRAGDDARNLARHDDALTLTQLLSLAGGVLAPAGMIWLLLPVEADARLTAALGHTGLRLRQQIDLRSKPDKPVARRIVGLVHPTPGVDPPRPHRRELCIHDPYPAYSPDCLGLLRPYYLSL